MSGTPGITKWSTSFLGHEDIIITGRIVRILFSLYGADSDLEKFGKPMMFVMRRDKG